MVERSAIQDMIWMKDKKSGIQMPFEYQTTIQTAEIWASDFSMVVKINLAAIFPNKNWSMILSKNSAYQPWIPE